jgi:hypothetical protein
MISEDIIAVVSSIPSTIITYMSINSDIFPSSIRTLTYIIAFTIGCTLALHCESLRLLVKPRTIYDQ